MSEPEKLRLRQALWRAIQDGRGVVNPRIIEAVKDIEEAAERRGAIEERARRRITDHDDWINDYA